MDKNKPAQLKKRFLKKTIIIACGLFLCVILLEILLRLGGFIFLSLQDYKNSIAIQQRGAYRIMCLGESSTALGGNNSYPSQLEQILNKKELGIKFCIINKGIAGINTTQILSGLEYNLDKYNPDMVITLMGINDSGIKYYENINMNKLFFEKLRTYRLFMLILNEFKNVYSRRLNKRKNITGLIKADSLKRQEDLLKERGLKNEEIYFKLGKTYRESGKYAQAEEMFKNALSMNPKDERFSNELGKIYREQGNYVQAEEILGKSIEMNPKNYMAYIELGRCYREREEYKRAEQMLKKAISINPQNIRGYIKLAQCYMEQKKYSEAIEVLQNTCNINQNYDDTKYIYIYLSYCYMNQGMYKEAAEIYKKLLEKHPFDFDAYGALALCYQAQDKQKLAEEYFSKTERMKLEYYNPTTWYNYQRLKEIVLKRGIKLVCVQYPIRSVEPLKKMLGQEDGIIFVDNEVVFKNALKQARYDEYFVDQFGGDFGHCTKKGNRLLAENIASVILKDIFKK